MPTIYRRRAIMMSAAIALLIGLLCFASTLTTAVELRLSHAYRLCSTLSIMSVSSSESLMILKVRSKSSKLQGILILICFTPFDIHVFNSSTMINGCLRKNRTHHWYLISMLTTK